MQVRTHVLSFCSNYPNVERQEILAEIFTHMNKALSLYGILDYKRNFEYVKKVANKGSLCCFKVNTGESFIVPTLNGIVSCKEYYFYELNGVLYSYDVLNGAVPLKIFKEQLNYANPNVKINMECLKIK